MVRASRPCGAVIIAAILCVQMVWAAEPRGEAIDHRAADHATAYPWSAVAALFSGNHSECTAVAVAPDQAAHGGALFVRTGNRPSAAAAIVASALGVRARYLPTTGPMKHWTRIGHS
jgi:hypothetical protein